MAGTVGPERRSRHRRTRRPVLTLALPLALAVVLPALLGNAPALAQRAEPRLTPAPMPTAALPKLTPVGPVRGPALNPKALVQTAPRVAAALSAPIVPGKPAAPPPAPSQAKPAEPEPARPVAPASAPPALIPSPAPAAPPASSSQERTAARVSPPSPPPVPPAPAAEPKPEPPKPEQAKPETPHSEPPSRRFVRTTEDVNLRAGPSRTARVVDELEGGARLEAMGPANDGWVPVGRNGKALGYIAEGYLTAETAGRGKTATAATANSATPEPRPAVPGRYAKASREDTGCALPDDFPASRRRATIAGGSVARVLADANLRVAPACDAKVQDVLERGETVTVLDAVGSWYRVGRGGRTLGYVGASLLEERGRR